MSKPLVSVCIPAYNSAQFIERTIRSALSQTYPNIEVVVVDDCSTDNTVEVVRNIDDSRVRLICNEDNLGMTGNWNKCVESCEGEYVKLIPADDMLHPMAIAKSVEALSADEDVKLVIISAGLVDNDDKVVGSYVHWHKEGAVKGSKVAKTSAMINNFYGSPVCGLFRKSDFLKTGGFDPDIPYILDFDLWMGLSALGKVYFIKEKLCFFRVRQDSNTGVLIGSKGKEYTAEHTRLLDKHIAKKSFKMNRFERRISIIWRRLRNYIIALYIKIKS